MTKSSKQEILGVLGGAIDRLKAAGRIPAGAAVVVELEMPRQRGHGDLATNVAFLLSRDTGGKPRELAELITGEIKRPGCVEKVEVAGPGFINFFLDRSVMLEVLAVVEAEGAGYGSSDAGGGRRVLVEFVSANPTGPLHVGHGRNAAVGDALVKVLAAAGFEVTSEYYLNDSGNQIEGLGRSLAARYAKLAGGAVCREEDLVYRGDYLVGLAEGLVEEQGKDHPQDDIPFFSGYASGQIRLGIEKDLAEFGVGFDRWFSEKTLHEDDAIGRAVAELESGGFIYERDGAKWLRSSGFGDEKDRVVIRKNGQPTYLAADIAYHKEKLGRGYDSLINVWGADHHGYIPRTRAALQAMGASADMLDVVLIQLVKLFRDGKPVPMSTRSGEFVTLREVTDEVGRDAARFFFLMRRSDAQLDFDLELAKKESSENPVYYVQYAHARICSILGFAREQEMGAPEAVHTDLGYLKEEAEMELVKKIAVFPEIVEGAAMAHEPHRLTAYLQELAAAFHNFYDCGNRRPELRVVTEDRAVTAARLVLVRAARTVLANGLAMLGVSAPGSM